MADEIELPDDITIPPPPHVYGAGNNGEPRLIITHIVNNDFKSYSGRQALGPFHKSFNAIIGPNGSGKSNVIDSMMFVFGYRANKIRSKKLSVLIHDSENKTKATLCSVEVHFEKITDLDNGGYCTVPNSSFFIRRKATQDNTSQYYINEKKVLFKEVAALLQGNGIDLNHNRFLILQGEVEQIALMKPKAQNEHGDGMLEFLEDIIGSSRYKEAIGKLCKQVDYLDEERKDKLARVKVVEKDKDQLEPVHSEAIQYLRKKNERTVLDNQLLQYYIHVFSKEAETIKNKIEEAKQSLEESEKEVSASKEQKKAKAKECSKVAHALEKCHELLTKHKDEMRELETINVKVFEDRRYRKSKVKELTKKLEQEKQKLVNLASQAEKRDQDLEDLTEDRDETAAKKKEIEEKLHEAMQTLKPETQQLQDEKEKIENDLLEKMKYVNDAKQELDVAKVELQLLQTQVTNAENALDQCNSQIEHAKMAEEKVSNSLKEALAMAPKLEQEIATLTEKLKELRSKEKKLGQQTDEYRSTLADAKLSEVNRSNQKVFKFLQQMKTSGKIPGIYGRLGDLGAIEDRYDVAISSCCSALENILVDDINTAQKCVRALKENDVGQATFIALNKMEKYKSFLNSNARTPSPRLVDLIKLKEEKFRVAFYHALHDTLVADDLNSASKVAYDKNRRWRVVTLQGEVIDTSGTMSGGGNKTFKGRMGTSCVNQDMSVEDITHLKRKYEEKEEELGQVRANILSSEEELSTKKSELLQCKSSIKLQQQDVASQQNLLPRLKSRLSELKQSLVDAQPDPVAKKKLEKNVHNLGAVYDGAVKKTSILEEKKEAIHEKICKINERRLKPFRSSLEEQKEKLQEFIQKITKLKAASSASKRATTKCEKNIEFNTTELEQNTEEIKSLEEQWKKLETEGAAVIEAMNTVTQAENEQSEELRNKEAEYKEFEDLQHAAVENLKKMQETVQCLSAEFNTNSEKTKQWNDHLLKLKLHEIEGEEESELKKLTEEEMDAICEQEIKTRITVLDSETENLHPNMNVIAEFREKQQVYLQRVAELDDVTSKRDNYRKSYDQLRKLRLNEFSEGFLIITNKLKEIYQMITLGGDAELEFVDSLDPFSEGIIFSVRPPKKSWKSICNLSGGEKTLSSLSLVFALHHYRPTPLYVMDEIDAALDFKNVTIIAHYIVERTKNAQFIIVSLRNNMFEVADRLVGIYKTDNCTKTATIEPALLVQSAE